MRVMDRSKMAPDNDTELRHLSRQGNASKQRRGKQFVAQNSPLTDLLKLDHVYNIYVLYIQLFLVHALLHSITFEKFDLGLNILTIAFGKGTDGMLMLILMTSLTVGVYGCFCCWATQRHHFTTPSKTYFCLWDYGWLIAFAVFQSCFTIIPGFYILKWRFGEATTIVVTFMQVVLLMKSHSFVRSNAPRVIEHNYSGTSHHVPCPVFSQFVYFLFCPTLLYRDSYPRTAAIRWGVMFTYILEIAVIFSYLAMIFELWLLPLYGRIQDPSPTALRSNVYILVGSFSPLVYIFFISFYLFSHAIPNASAEMLRFADRRFYVEWWTAKSPAALFRLWNLLVQEWIYEYIYCDIRDLFNVRSKLLLKVIVFAISTFYHEYIAALMFRFWYPMQPALLTLVAGTTPVYLLMSRFKGENVCHALFFMVFVCGFFTLSMLEIYARANCLQTEEGWADFFSWPRSWNCIPIATKVEL